MMMKNLMRTAALFLVIAQSTALFAQKSSHPEATNCDGDYCWGDKREEGKVQFAMYSDNYNFGDYAWKDAEPALNWLMENLPYLHIGMYVNGYKIYNFLEANEKDPETKKIYQDRLLRLLDSRIKYFGEEKENLQRKGLKAYPFLVTRGKDQYDGLFQLYDRIFELNGQDTYSTNLLYLMAMVKIQKQTGKLTDDQVLDYHDRVTNVIQKQVAKETDKKEVAVWQDVQKQIDDIVSKVVVFDCAKIRDRIAKDLKENPENLDVSKRALRYLIQGKCTDDPMFLVAAEGVFKHEPTGSLASIISKKYLINQDYTNALAWYDKAIELQKDSPATIAELYFDKAQVFNVLGKKSEARSNALKAAELNPDFTSKAYSFVGDLYMNSGNLCQDANPVKYRAIFLAAYEAYSRAGDGAKMAAAQQQFPSIEEIFVGGYKEGDRIEVGCWIGGSVTLRRR